ncbi:MAG: holo-ACP synthase [Gemmatimonadales bacterium]
MNTLGVGIDLVDVDRVAGLLERKAERAVTRLLTDSEREYCFAQPVPARHVAARIAAKEAAYKALQVNETARAIGWRDIEVLRGNKGEPTLKLQGLARSVADDMGVAETLVSISHSASQAAAVVILLG